MLWRVFPVRHSCANIGTLGGKGSRGGDLGEETEGSHGSLWKLKGESQMAVIGLFDCHEKGER